MKILTANNIRKADLFTIENEPIPSLDLMERAAEELAGEICNRLGIKTPFLVVAGRGNNGGDGLALARILYNAGASCAVVMPVGIDNATAECRANLERLPGDITVQDVMPENAEGTILIDALFGAGIRDELPESYLDVITAINRSGAYIVSIDLPSGMKTEFGNDPAKIVHADLTLAVEYPKVAMFLPEAGECCGEIAVVKIGLDPNYGGWAASAYNYIDAGLIKHFIKARPKFSHKGTYGHLLLVCGSKGMTGASILSTAAALRSGCGLVTTHLPGSEAAAMYASNPSAIVSPDDGECFTRLPADADKYDCIGIGCGLGKDPLTVTACERLFRAYEKPMVIDADAINIVSDNHLMMEMIPQGSILTPHPGELKRLVGEWSGDGDKIRKCLNFTAKHNCILVVKGAHTMVCDPGGGIYFNFTGSPALAKGGSGDVLTGLMSGLVARGYTPLQAAIAAIWLHGRAGDKAAEYYGVESMNGSDIPDFIPEAFASLSD